MALPPRPQHRDGEPCSECLSASISPLVDMLHAGSRLDTGGMNQMPFDA
jgi:hypothetical protein